MASKLLLVNSSMPFNATGWVMVVSIRYKTEKLSSEKMCIYFVHSELETYRENRLQIIRFMPEALVYREITDLSKQLFTNTVNTKKLGKNSRHKNIKLKPHIKRYKCQCI